MFTPWKESYDLLDSILKSRDIALSTKVRLVKAMVFPVVMCGCESWTVKKAECQGTDAFELWCWRRLLRVPWTVRRSNQSVLKEIKPVYPKGDQCVHWRDWCWSWDSSTLATWCIELIHWKRPWCWERLKIDAGKGRTEDEMAGWHHRLIGHGFGWTPRVGDGQGGLVCYGSWGCKELDMTEWLTWTEI